MHALLPIHVRGGLAVALVARQQVDELVLVLLFLGQQPDLTKIARLIKFLQMSKLALNVSFSGCH